MKELSGLMEILCILSGVVVTQLYTFITLTKVYTEKLSI